MSQRQENTEKKVGLAMKLNLDLSLSLTQPQKHPCTLLVPILLAPTAKATRHEGSSRTVRFPQAYVLHNTTT